MSRLALVLGLFADGALLALLIGISGFVFEGPEGARSDPSAVAVWTIGVVGTLAAALGAVLLARPGRIERAALLAAAPPVIGILLAFGVGELIFPP